MLQCYLYKFFCQTDIRCEYNKMKRLNEACEERKVCNGSVLFGDRFSVFWLFCWIIGMTPFDRYIAYLILGIWILLMGWLFNKFFVLCSRYNLDMKKVKSTCYSNYVVSIIISGLLYSRVHGMIITILLWSGVFVKYLWKYKVSQLVYDEIFSKEIA